MLKSIVNGDQQTRVILIEDTWTARGDDLFISFLKNLPTSGSSFNNVVMVCLEKPSQYYSETFGIPNNQCLDMWSEKLNLKKYKDRWKDCIVLIDSISMWILKTDAHTCYRDVYYITKQASKVIGVFHGDVSVVEVKDNFKFLSTSYLCLKSWCDGKGVVDVLLKKPGGKVVKQIEKWTISEQYIVHSIANETILKPKPTVSSNEFETLTTFKLGLKMSENEQLAKSQLVLPYLRNQPVVKESKIVYDAEPDDDLEEDPDDDLDV